MSIAKTFLGLLEGGPAHGYDLKRTYDERFGQDRPLAYGQVYATLSRLLKHGFVEVSGVEPGGGPERKRYAITETGVADVDAWLAQPERPEPYLQSTLYTKVVLALLTLPFAFLGAALLLTAMLPTTFGRAALVSFVYHALVLVLVGSVGGTIAALLSL